MTKRIAELAELAEGDRGLVAAEAMFSHVLRAAADAGRWGRFGVSAQLDAGRVIVLHVEQQETVKLPLRNQA